MVDEPKNEKVTVRFTTDELNAIKVMCNEYGISTSAYIRGRAIEHLDASNEILAITNNFIYSIREDFKNKDKIIKKWCEICTMLSDGIKQATKC